MSDFETTVKTMQPVKLERIGEGKFNAHLATYSNGWKAVCKHDSSNKVFRRLPTNMAHRREEAFFHLAELIYPGVVPETYVCEIRGKECSAQKYTPGIHARAYDSSLFDTERSDFGSNFKSVIYGAAPKADWKRLAMLDLVGNSRDRHGKNVLLRPGNKLPIMAIDNGFSLGKTFRSYRNVFHRYLFNYHFYAPHLLKELEKLELLEIREAIVPLLEPVYAEHVRRRIDWVLEFPHRLPWRIISCGADRTVDFPSYKRFFSPDYRRLPERRLMVKATPEAAA